MRSLTCVILLASAGVAAADPRDDKGTGACAGMTYGACLKKALLYEYGAEGMPKDRKKAQAMYAAACDVKIAVACSSAGERAKEAGFDEAAARRWFQKSCDLDASLCVSYGFYLEEQDAPADVKQGIALLARSCDAGWGLACYKVADHAITKGEAASWEKKRCEAKDSPDCARYIRRLWKDEAGLTAVASTKALETLCDDGEANACSLVAQRHLDGKGAKASRASADVWMGKACDAGSTIECRSLGRRAAFDDNDRKRAALWFEKACKQGDETSCDMLARVKR